MPVKLTTCSNPFTMQRTESVIIEGITVAEAMARYGFPEWVQTGVCLNGAILRDYSKILNFGDILTVNAMPSGKGGKNPLRTILTIAVVAVSAFVVGPAVAGALGFSKAASPLMYGLVSGLAGGAATAIGMLAVNAIAPPPTPSLSLPNRYEYKDSPTYGIASARNRQSQYGPVPILLGRFRIFPPYGAMPFTERASNDQYVNMLFCEGHGPINKTALRLGETAINNFDDVETEIKDGTDSTRVALFPSDVFQEELSIQLTKANGYQQRTTQPNTTRIMLDFTFPQGIVEIQDDGKRINHSVALQIQSTPTGAGTWTDHGTITTSGKTTSTRRRAFRINVSLGHYDVRVRRTTNDSTSIQIIDSSFWTSMRSYQPGWPITEALTAKTAVRIKASEQLNGTPDNFNCIAVVECLDYNPGSGTWSLKETSNPASLFRYALQGPGNLRPKTNAQINLTNLAEFWEHCNDNGFEFNHYVDYRTDLETILKMVASAGRAAPGYVDGKIGVVIDNEKTDIVQHFTPRNSWGYKYEKLLTDIPHAFRVKFWNEDKDYREDERMVYDDGYHAGNATKFEELSLPGITSSDLAWKHGRYHIAAARLRPERHMFNVDFENLVCTRGDLVLFQQDVISVGLVSCRVKSYETDAGDVNITQVTVDAECTMATGTDYCLRVRKENGTSIVIPIATNDGVHTELEVDGDWPNIAANIPDIGALAMFGESENESIELVVKDIRPIGDLSAELTCVPHAPEIYDADTGAIPEFETNITGEVTLSPPAIKTIRTGVDLVVFKTDDYEPRSEIILRQPSDFSANTVIQAQTRAENTDEWVWNPVNGITRSSIILSDFVEGDYYDFRVRFNDPADLPSEWQYSNNRLIVGTTAPPSNVDNFLINIIGDQAYLSWDRVTDVDLSHYVLRFSSQVSGAGWASSTGLINRIDAGAVAITAPAMVGTYLIKAVGAGGRESETASTIVTNVAALTRFNVVETITEDPAFSGTKTGCEVDGSDRLIMSGNPNAGDFSAYDFAGNVDLGAVYTSRVSVDLVVSGISLTINVFERADWFEAADFFGNVAEKYGVVVYLKTTNDDPAVTPEWSEWKKLVVGDYSARAYQFKAILSSYETGIIAAVSQLSVHVDMPDRVIAEDDLIVPNTGLTITFDPQYKALSGVAVSGQDMATGEYYKVTAKSTSGFTLTFYDSTDTAIERTADYVAVGYGVQQ